MGKLSSKKPTTVKNYMNAIIVVLSAVKADTELIDKYTGIAEVACKYE
eukprot:SAG22_NODE_18_length_32591_cov_38.043549_22_plen_48_part_00